MKVTKRAIVTKRALMFSVFLGSGLLLAYPLRADDKPDRSSRSDDKTMLGDRTPLTEDQKILHVLNRLGFGARPGDGERVKKMGLKSYVEEQLHPEAIKDNPIEQKLAGFSALKLSGMEISQMEGEVQRNNQQVQRIQNEMAQRGAKEGAGAIQGAINNGVAGTQPTPQQRQQGIMAVYRDATPEQRKQLEAGRMAREKVNQAGAQLVVAKITRAVESEKQLQEVMVDFWSNHFNIDAAKVRAAKVQDEEQVIRPHVLGKFREILGASAHSAAMMLYLDNAQSVSETAPAGGGQQRQITFQQMKRGVERGLPFAKQIDERVQKTATDENITEEQAFEQVQKRQKQFATQKRGINENYARELMELHTLGVDGGYTQNDVREVARCLTGWGVRGGRYGGEFEYHAFAHDRGEKMVLGNKIPAGGGPEDGEKVLDILANSPATMKHVSTELCQRFVSDNPPEALVNKCVATWKKTDGNIREILNTIFNSPEFYSRDAYQQKIKSPFEYVVSSVRAIGATVDDKAIARFATVSEGNTMGMNGMGSGGGMGMRGMGVGAMRNAGGINPFAQGGTGQNNVRLLAGQIGTLGQPLFNYAFPTGYPEESTKWVSSGALIGRINFALSLVSGKLNDVKLAELPYLSKLDQKPSNLVEQIGSALLHGQMTPATRATLLKQASMKPEKESIATETDLNKRLTALVLGAPEFQRR